MISLNYTRRLLSCIWLLRLTKALKKSDDINEPGCDLARIHVKNYKEVDYSSEILFITPLIFEEMAARRDSWDIVYVDDEFYCHQ